MMFCPTCSKRLLRRTTAQGPLYACSCGGRAVTFDTLEHAGREDVVRRVRLKSLGSRKGPGRRCPLCAGKMAAIDFPLGGGDRGLALDACERCGIVWFDPNEFQALAPETRPPGRPPALPTARPPGLPPARPGGVPAVPPLPAAAKRPRATPPPVAQTGPSIWQVLPAILGLPIEMDRHRLRDKPVVTRGLVTIMLGLFAVMAMDGPGVLTRAILDWGMIPSRWDRHDGLTLVTSFFLHASWWHVIANMYFLWIFGDNVEDRLGHVRFVALLAVSHAAGMWTQGAFGGAPDVPCVGASAGISGVLAYYALAFPAARIGIFGWILTLFRILRIPALAGLVIYALLQAWGAYAAEPGEHVAYMAHLGGLAAGAVCALFAQALSKT